MLKRLVIIVVALVFIKPVYDVGTEVYNEIKLLINQPSVEVIDVVDGNLQSTSMQMDIGIPAVENKKGKLTNKVRTLEELTEAFYYYFSDWQTDFDIHFVGSTKDLEHMIKKAADEAANKDEYIKGHLSNREIEYEYTKTKAKIKVHQEYLTNKTQEQFVDQKVTEILSTVNAREMSEYEKVKFVNDYIVKNTVYGTDTVSASPHSAFAVLKEGKAVCQGYALLALKMLKNLGVETRYVVGEVNTGGHAWNLVKLNGEWYHLDTTWNDPVPDRPNTVSYKYFLIDDNKIKKDHVWNSNDYPKATSTKYAFMAKVDQGYMLGDYLYYSNAEDDYRLYRVNVQTGKSELVSNNRAQYIVGYGDWLFFSNYSNGAYLTKMKTDGTEETILYQNEVKDLFIDDGYLYFTTTTGKKKIEL